LGGRAAVEAGAGGTVSMRRPEEQAGGTGSMRRPGEEPGGVGDCLRRQVEEDDGGT